jgi:hypothetical protein
MKKYGVFTLVLVLCRLGLGQSVPFARLGSPFAQTNFEVVWAAPTNNLACALWVYRALPSEVSPTVISNLVGLGSFTDKDRKNLPDALHLISYDNLKKSLLVKTDWSFIDYQDSSAENMHITEGVPDKEKAFEIATNWLPKLNVDRSQLAKKENGDLRFTFSELITTLYKGRGMPAYATNISMSDVTFKRTLDGVEISGGSARGGCEIQIGNHAKIRRILVSWRKYTREKRYPTATPEQLLKWIREGKAAWYPPPDSPFTDLGLVKKITITKLTPLYYSDAYGLSDKPYNWAVPFAELEARVDNDETNFTVNIDCPLINKSKL